MKKNNKAENADKKELSIVQTYALSAASQKVLAARKQAENAESTFAALLDAITDELGVAADERKEWRLANDYGSIVKIDKDEKVED